MRDRWLLQGMGPEEEESRRKQLELDEEQGRRLEHMIHRLESEIGALESEESQISAKEQILRERLKETERSIEDLQKSLLSKDDDATGRMSALLSDCMEPDPNHLILAAQPCGGPPASVDHAAPRPAMFAMEINVQHDPRTGEQRILSANRVNPLDAAQRGVKVYDDGRKVVYEVMSSGGVSTTTVENGWSSAQVDELVQQAVRPVVQGGDFGKGHVRVTPAAPEAYVSPADVDDLSPPSCAPPSIPSSPPAQVTLQRETRLGMIPPSAPIITQPGRSAQSGNEANCPPQASMEHPVTMVFLGYHDVEDMSESRRLLGFDGTVKAEVVLIDEDDEKSLREKTVTDISVIDGTAADLVSGRPATSEAISTELSSDGREQDSGSSPPANPDAHTAPPPGLTPATGDSQTRNVMVSTSNCYQAPDACRDLLTTMKPHWASEDVSESTPRERVLKTVSFQESVSFITDAAADMELESQQIQHGCLSGPPVQRVDSEVVQEICYLDQVLDEASNVATNGNASPSEHTRPISISGNSPHVSMSAPTPSNHQQIIVEGQQQRTLVHQEASAVKANGHVLLDEAVRSKPKFELRPFQEEKRPAKLFSPGEEQQVRVTRTRPSEEVQELERERQELIKGQAVKKNPGIAQRWWNPPQEVPLEQQLEAEKLESLKKYQERKQQKQSPSYLYTQPQLSGPPTMVTFDQGLTRKEDIVEEQIDFFSARQQFLQAGGAKKDEALPANPFKPLTSSSEMAAETGETHVTWSDEGPTGAFTCARAVMTILPEEEQGPSPFPPSSHPEESDSGLDELSVRSQDTTLFSLDNVSDSGASLPPTPLPLTPVSPPTPQPTTPVNGQSNGGPTEAELEYHSGVVVQNAIQNALQAHNGGQWQPSAWDCSQLSAPLSPSSPATSSPVPVSSSPSSSGGASSLQSPVSSSPTPPTPSPQPPKAENSSESSGPAPQARLLTPSPPHSQPVSPQQRPRNGGPRIKIQSSYTRALASSNTAPASAPAPAEAAPVPRPAAVCRPPSPPTPDKPEFSYFSKYSEAAELRSTATATRGPEVEAASGPFRLRSKKQKTLSMIEEEIRAAQQREEELKKQREAQPAVVTGRNSSGPVRTGARQTTISPADKMKSNSLPARLTLTTKTAPGKIEKVRPAPPVSPSPSEGALSDAGSEDSAGSRPKNFMQTLMEDYETHKVKRREKMEDNSYAHLLLANEVTTEVLEATRVTRRKSNMALKWEAGIYANEKEDEEEEEEEEEE
ncbi:palm2 and akap2 fusion isoform X4 [Oryzias latipes]